MKIFKYIFAGIIFLTGCSDYDYDFTYPENNAKTKVGKLLTENTDLFSTVYEDTTYTVTQGVELTKMAYLSKAGKAMRIYVVEVDLTVPGLTMKVSTPVDSEGKPKFDLEPLDKQILHFDKPQNAVWAAINADFFDSNLRKTRGAMHQNGVVLNSSFQLAFSSFFAITDDNKAVVYHNSEYAAKVQELNLPELVSGGVLLIKDGNIVEQTDVTIEPRTCIGVTSDGLHVKILLVEGRRFSFSNGMSFIENAKCLHALGAANAVSLDGGGSSTLLTRTTPDFVDNRFELINWPNDKGGEIRAIGNGLMVVSTN